MPKRKRITDPYTEREARRYKHPIASRELILELVYKHEGPIQFDTLVAQLGLKKNRDIEALSRRLEAMAHDGQIVRNRLDEILPVDQQALQSGRVVAHPDGHGFLMPEEGDEQLYLSPREMRVLLHGDRAVVRVVGIDRRGRLEAAVVEILERHNQEVVGRLYQESGISFVIPDNKRIHQDIFIPPQNLKKAKNGQIVTAAIIEQPTKRSQPIGKVIEVLGDHMAPGMEIDVATRAHGLPHTWPTEVTHHASSFTKMIPEDAKQGRLDLRELAFVTIDGEDAKDFDDAVYCEPTTKGWHLLVAIADVAHYVRAGDAIDNEARLRGTSVYFPGRVIPMLPEVLSNTLCSLMPNVERLCVVCDMHINKEGKITKFTFDEAVIRSKARLTYTQVAAVVVDRRVNQRRKIQELVQHLDNLYDLYHALYKTRVKRGAIDFDSMETQIVFGKDKKIEKILPLNRNDAHRIIEECMIAANMCAAHALLKNKIPGLFRIHDGPDEDKLVDLRNFLVERGLNLGGGNDPQPGNYAQVIEKVKHREDAHVIQTIMLRSLSQAMYSPDNIGHFGLALEDYAHFTSPIRRYPDLLVHRAVKHQLEQGKAKNFEYSHHDMLALGEHCSMAERRADDATRDVIYWLKCEYMLDKVDEEFDGVISAVTSFGVFVELRDIFVEGLIHVTSLDKDYYVFDPVAHCLVGENSGQAFQLGDEMRVRVVRVDLDERKIDFLPVRVPKRKRRVSVRKGKRRVTKKSRTRKRRR